MTMQTTESQFTLLTASTQDAGYQTASFVSDIRIIRSVNTTKMTRTRNTDQQGNQWSDEIIKLVWEKGRIIPGFNPDKYRKDCCGAWMQYDKFGYISENGVGWEIDHVKPVSKGGTDELSNLQPLQWQNNRSKNEDFPALEYAVIGSN